MNPDISPKARRSSWRVVRNVVLGLLLLVVVLVIGILVFLRTETGRAQVESIALMQLQNLLTEDAEVEIQHLDGSFLRGARLIGAVVREGGEPALEIDTLTIRYRLLPLIRQTFVARDIYANGVRVWAIQRPDSSWNVANILKPSEEPSEEPLAWTIQLDRIRLTNGYVQADFYNPVRDSILVADPLELELSDFVFDADGLATSLDNLTTSLMPAAVEPVPISLLLAGRIEAEEIELWQLHLSSARTDVRGSAVAAWGENITFGGDILADPLDFEDIRQFIDVPLYGRMDLRLQAQGSPENAIVRLAADFDGRGTVDVNGIFAAGDGPVRISGEGSIVDLDVGYLIGNPALAGQINAVADADLAGSTFQTLSGDIDVQVRETQIGEAPAIRGDLVGRFDQGDLRFTLGAAVRNVRLLANGTASPFADPLVYDVSGEINDVDLAVLLQDPEQQTTIRHVRYHVRGRGTDPNTLTTEADIALSDGQFGEFGVNALRLHANLVRGALTFDTDADFGQYGGRIAAAGSARPFAEPLTFVIDEGTFNQLNPAVLTGNPENTGNLSGAFIASGRGTDTETMQLELAGVVNPSTFRHLTINHARLDGFLDSGDLRIELIGDMGTGGSLTLVGDARPFDEVITYDLAGDVRNINLAILTDNPNQFSDLNGTIRVSGSGTDPTTLATTLDIDLEPSRFREQEIIAGNVGAELSDGNLNALLHAQIPGGSMSTQISGQPFAEVPQFAVSNGNFEGVNLGLILDQSDLETNLSGSFEGTYTGSSLETAVGSAHLSFRPTSINSGDILHGNLAADLDNGAVTAAGTFTAHQGAAGLAMSGRPFDEEPSFNVDLRADSLDVIAFIGNRREQSSLNMTAILEIDGTDLETMYVIGEIEATDSRFPSAHIDSFSSLFVLDDGILELDEMLLDADFAELEAFGQFALFNEDAETDIELEGAIHHAGPINLFLEEELYIDEAVISAHATGRINEPIYIDLQTTIRQVAYGNIGGRRLDARADLEYDSDSEEPLLGRSRIRFDFLSLPTFNLRNGDISISNLNGDLTAEGHIQINNERELTFAGHLENFEDDESGFNMAVVLDDLTLNMDGHQWVLDQSAQILMGDGQYRVRNFLLDAGNQQIIADGIINLQGDQTMVLFAENVDVAPFADLFGYEDVGGNLSMSLALLGSADAPEIEGDITITDISSGGEPVGALEVTINYSDSQLELDAELTHINGSDLTIEGFIPFVFRLDGVETEPDGSAPVDLTIRSEAFPISWAEPFLPPRVVTELGGYLTTNITVGGTQQAPRLDGEARVTDGRLAMEATGNVVFQNALLTIQLDGNTATITEGRVEDGRGGSLITSGTITLPQLSVGELDLSLVMNELRVIDTRTYRGLTLSATPNQNLRFRGTLTDPILHGGVTLVSGDIYMTDELMGQQVEEVELSSAQIQRVEEVFDMRVVAADTSQSAFMEQLDLNITVGIERNVWIRSRQNFRFDIEFYGNLTVEKEPGGENLIFGNIDVNRGRVDLPTLAGRSFNIGAIDDTYGRLTFNGPIPETVAEIRAGLEAPAGTGRGVSATIFLNFSGRIMENPELELSSDPSMSTSDIACVVATGRPCGEAFSGGAEEIAINQLGAMVQGIAGQQLGLDVVEITQRPTGEIVVTVGSYVTNRTFASVSQPVTGARDNVRQGGMRGPEVMLEYEIQRWLMTRLERRNLGGVGGTLLFQVDY